MIGFGGGIGAGAVFVAGGDEVAEDGVGLQRLGFELGWNWQARKKGWVGISSF